MDNLDKALQEIPEFSLPEKELPPYTWWGWHPNYPQWSRSCWKGTSIDEAVENLIGEETYYMVLVSPQGKVVKTRKPTHLKPWEKLMKKETHKND